MDKKGDQGTPVWKIITLVLVVLVVIFSFVVLSSSAKARDFLENLPDFLRGGNPVNLTVEAEVYGADVELLVNDGEGRCIVNRILEVNPDGTVESLLNYGISKNELLIRSSPNAKDWEPPVEKMLMDRVTTDMISQTPGGRTYYTIRDQIIKQDLFVGCYRDEKDFKTATILGSEVTLLKKDEFKRCLIFEAKSNPILEHYAIDKKLGGSDLYGLNISGKWILLPQVSEEQIREAEIVAVLRKTEADILNYLDSQEIKMCGSEDPQDPMCTTLTFSDYSKGGIGNYVVYRQPTTESPKPSMKQFYFYKPDSEWTYLKDAIDEKIRELGSEESPYFRKCIENEPSSPCYLAIKDGAKVYGVRAGIGYIFNSDKNGFIKLSAEQNPLLSYGSEGIQLSERALAIKKELEREC